MMSWFSKWGKTPGKGPETSQDHGQMFNFFVVWTGETCGAYEKLIGQLEAMGQIEKKSVDQSDYILAFCPTPSQNSPKIDVEEAMGKIPRGKPVILVVMHHIKDAGACPVDSSKHVNRADVILTVDTLFWKGEFLMCMHNDEAFSKIWDRIYQFKDTMTSTGGPLPRSRKLCSFFVVVTGETCGAHETFIGQLQHGGMTQKNSLDQSDFILAFCPCPSRTGTDVIAAMGKIPSGKPVILVVMHHKHDVEAYLDDSSKHVTRGDVILTVDTLFWERKFLKCSHNEEALRKVLEPTSTMKTYTSSSYSFVTPNERPTGHNQDTTSTSISEEKKKQDTEIQPWKINFGQEQIKDTLLNSVKEFHPENKEHIRILLHGPVGSGKSSFINSVSSVLKKRMSHDATVEAGGGGYTYTTKYKTHKIKEGHFMFNELTGLGGETGVHEEDIRLALKGHVMDGYMFNPAAPMSDKDPHYNRNPAPEDQTHVLVLVIPANQMTSSSIESMKKMRDIADKMDIPLICILTKIDEASSLVKNDVKKVYQSKNLKEKMEEVRDTVWIPEKSIFPVKNYHDETALNDDIDVLILKAVQHMINLREDVINKMETS